MWQDGRAHDSVRVQSSPTSVVGDHWIDVLGDVTPNEIDEQKADCDSERRPLVRTVVER